MAKAKAAHHRGTYQVRARKVVDLAKADPSTQCWRCGRTMTAVRRLKPRARWTAGHLTPGQVDGPLAPECSPCNFGHGARMGNARRRLRRSPRTDLTW